MVDTHFLWCGPFVFWFMPRIRLGFFFNILRKPTKLFLSVPFKSLRPMNVHFFFEQPKVCLRPVHVAIHCSSLLCRLIVIESAMGASTRKLWAASKNASSKNKEHYIQK